MKIIRPLLYLLLILVGAFLMFLLYSTINDYRPDEATVQSTGCESYIISDSMQIELLIWNIGYAGLDASMDFFYDGGEQMRPGNEGVGSNMEGITRTLAPYIGFDFILLQEVDQDSKRSYHINEYQDIKELIPISHLHKNRLLCTFNFPST